MVPALLCGWAEKPGQKNRDLVGYAGMKQLFLFGLVSFAKIKGN